MTKFHFLPFQKWPKINFWTGKNFKTAKNAISRKKLFDLFVFTYFLPTLKLHQFHVWKSTITHLINFCQWFWNWGHRNSCWKKFLPHHWDQQRRPSNADQLQDQKRNYSQTLWWTARCRSDVHIPKNHHEPDETANTFFHKKPSKIWSDVPSPRVENFF